MILLGKGKSISKAPIERNVIAINDAVYSTDPSQVVLFVRCDYGSRDILGSLPYHIREVFLWEGLKRYNLYPDRRVTYFSNTAIGLPKRLCTLWMTLALHYHINGSVPLDMYGFDHLAGKSFEYGPYINKENIVALQDQRPTSWYLPKAMLEKHTLQPWGLNLWEVLRPYRRGYSYTLSDHDYIVMKNGKEITRVGLQYAEQNPEWLLNVFDSFE